MPTVTALRSVRRGRVAVELDGARWRTLPTDVVVRAAVAVGTDLDRPRLRTIRRELRRAEALALASRALRARDLSAQELRVRLERRVGSMEGTEAVATLARVGFVDDARVARSRAATMAERGYGDEAIRFDLARRGIEAELAEAAISELEPETERATTLVARRGGGAQTARFLAARGFGEEVIERAGFANDP